MNSSLSTAVAKDISSFMNSKGGTLFVGIADDKKILGIQKDFETFGQGKQNDDGFQLHFVQIMKNLLGVSSLELILLRFEELDGQRIARIDVTRSEEPVYLKVGDKTEFYVRIQGSSHPLNLEEAVKYISSHWPRYSRKIDDQKTPTTNNV